MILRFSCEFSGSLAIFPFKSLYAVPQLMADTRLCVTFSTNKDVFRTSNPKRNDADLPKYGPASAPVLHLPIESKKAPLLLLPIASKSCLFGPTSGVPRGMSCDSTDVESPVSASPPAKCDRKTDRVTVDNIESRTQARWADIEIPHVNVHPDTSIDHSPLVRETKSFVQKFSGTPTRGCVEQIYIYSQTEVETEEFNEESPTIISY